MRSDHGIELWVLRWALSSEGPHSQRLWPPSECPVVYACDRDRGAGRARARSRPLSRPRAAHPLQALRARGLGLLLQQQVQTFPAEETRRPCEFKDEIRKYEPPACLSVDELACARRCKARGLMRGAGGQVEPPVVNGAKEMLQSAAVRDNVLGATRGSPRVVVSLGTESEGLSMPLVVKEK